MEHWCKRSAFCELQLSFLKSERQVTSPQGFEYSLERLWAALAKSQKPEGEGVESDSQEMNVGLLPSPPWPETPNILCKIVKVA